MKKRYEITFLDEFGFHCVDYLRASSMEKAYEYLDIIHPDSRVINIKEV